MALPENLAQELELTDEVVADGVLADGLECEAALYHSPNPLVVFRVELGDGSRAWLCGTCRANLEVFRHMRATYDEQMPWPLRREFGNRLRALGERA